MAAEGAAPASGQLSWRIAAWLLAGVHVAYVVYVLFGALLIAKWPWMIWPHLAAVAWAGCTMLFDFGCPVTDWEKASLRRAGREPYPEGFLQHHVFRRTFSARRARLNHILLGVAAILLNVWLYSRL
jgi:hypothetical protein